MSSGKGYIMTGPLPTINARISGGWKKKLQPEIEKPSAEQGPAAFTRR
jgi:hypothetical protein